MPLMLSLIYHEHLFLWMTMWWRALNGRACPGELRSEIPSMICYERHCWAYRPAAALSGKARNCTGRITPKNRPMF